MILDEQERNKKKTRRRHHATTQKIATDVTPIVIKFLGRPGRGTGSRVEGRHFIKLWYEGGIPLWNDKLLCGTRL